MYRVKIMFTDDAEERVWEDVSRIVESKHFVVLGVKQDPDAPYTFFQDEDCVLDEIWYPVSSISSMEVQPIAKDLP